MQQTTKFIFKRCKFCDVSMLTHKHMPKIQSAVWNSSDVLPKKIPILLQVLFQFLALN